MSRFACCAAVVACLVGVVSTSTAVAGTAFGPLAPLSGLSCTDSWKSATSGDWFTPANWSTGSVPASSDDVCITISGTYTVTMAGGTPSVNSVTLGGSTGAETLAVLSTCSVHAVLTTASGLTVNASGVVAMGNSDGCSNNSTLAGPVTNQGAVHVRADAGGSRFATGTFLNEGAVSADPGASLTVPGGATFTNGAGGSVSDTGAGGVFVSGGTFTQGAGTTSGAEPVIVDDGSVGFTGAGAATITTRGASTLAGNTAAGQTLRIASTCSEHAALSAAASLTSAGAIVLTNDDGCANNATLTVTSPATLTNTGTITSQAASGGQRNLDGAVTNKGTIAVAPASAEVDLRHGAGTLSNATGGTITAPASSTPCITTPSCASVLVVGGTYESAGGTTSGAEPVIVDDAAVSFTGGGASVITAQGTSTLSGGPFSGQTLRVASTCSEHTLVTAASSLTSAGAIVLANDDGCADNATLTMTSPATLTNTGTITSQAVNGGQRNLNGNVTNKGTLGVAAAGTNDDLHYGSGTLSNATGGTISGPSSGTAPCRTTPSCASVVVVGGGTYQSAGGATSGTEPVIVDDAALKFTGGGASIITTQGNSTLSGGPKSGQTLRVASSCAEHAVLTAGSSLTSAGTIALTNDDSCADNATVVVTSPATLTNTGTVQSLNGVGGTRTFDGNVVNHGTVLVDPAGTLVDGGGTVTNGTGGVISSTTGSFVVSSGTLDEAAGGTSGAEPAVVDDGTLDYAGAGASTIAARGASTLVGAPSAGQTLLVASTCAEHATLSAGATANAGNIVLRNDGRCGDNATLELGGATLTNTGTVTVVRGFGGVRSIDGNLVTNGTVDLQNAHLSISGGYTQSSPATLMSTIGSASKFGSLTAGGAAALDGTLALTAKTSPTSGHSYVIVTGASRTGSWAQVQGVVGTTGFYFVPFYTPTTAGVVAQHATATLTPTSGAAGSSVTVGGSGWPASDTVTPTFTDAHGTATVLPALTASPSGALSGTVQVPPSAVAGQGSVTFVSGATGATVVKPFTVVPAT